MKENNSIVKVVKRHQKVAWKYVKHYCCDKKELKTTIMETKSEEALAFVLLDNEQMRVFLKVFEGSQLINLWNAWSLYDYQKVVKDFKISEINKEGTEPFRITDLDASKELFEQIIQKLDFLTEADRKNLIVKQQKHSIYINTIKVFIKRKISELNWQISQCERSLEKLERENGDQKK